MKNIFNMIIKNKCEMNSDLKGNRVISKKEKRIKEFLIVLIVALITLFGYFMTFNYLDYDALWTFSFSSKIANGYVVYRDFNIVQTPLYAQITAIFLRVFGNTMIVSICVGIIECVFLIIIQYYILKKLKIPAKSSIFIVFLTFFYLIKIMCNSYNMLSMIFTFVLIYVEICKIRYDKYIFLTKKPEKIKSKMKYSFIYNAITGIILGLTFLAKQTTGVYSILAITLYYFLKSILVKDINFKQAFKELCVKAIFCILIISIELIYLYINGALYNFIDYTVLGLLHFGQKNTGGIINSLFNENNKWYVIIINGLLIFSVIFLVICIILKKFNLIKRKNRLDLNFLILSTLSCIIGIGFSIPLANTYHIYMTKYYIFYMFLANIFMVIDIVKKTNKNISKFAYVIMIIVPCICGMSNYILNRIYYNITKVNPYQYTTINQADEKDIEDVVTYINNYEEERNQPLYMITSNCSRYNLVLERNNGIFDLALYGNLGQQDYNAVINKLKSMDNYSVMIYNSDDSLFWQEPKEIPEYIRTNFEYIESFNQYEIYEKKTKNNNELYK